MPPYQERVVEEKRELDEKIAKLDAFLPGDFNMTLPVAERERLFCQLVSMQEYSRVLGERIAAFA